MADDVAPDEIFSPLTSSQVNFKTANWTYCRSGKYLFGQVYVFEPCGSKKKNKNKRETLDHFGPLTFRLSLQQRPLSPWCYKNLKGQTRLLLVKIDKTLTFKALL